MRFVLVVGEEAPKLAYTVLQSLLPKEMELEIFRDEMGKPYVKYPLSFNLSHTGGACAVLTDTGEVGIDIERIDRKVSSGLENHILSGEEKEYLLSQENHKEALIALWTRKEAYLKAIGKGISFPLKEVSTASRKGLKESFGAFKLKTMKIQDFFLTCATQTPLQMKPEIYSVEEFLSQNK